MDSVREAASTKTDDDAGMAWWNNLTDRERKRWADLVGTGRAKDAWELFKRADRVLS